MLSKRSIPYALTALTGLATSHHPTQKFIHANNLLPLLHKLEKTTTVKKIGNLAENLMEALREIDPENPDNSVKEAVENIRYVSLMLGEIL